MSLTIFLGWVCLLMSGLPQFPSESQGPPKFFNVMEYGAIADGVTDNSEAFLKAWKEACEWKGRARVFVPLGKIFTVNSMMFEGPCKGQMAFVIRGILKAPTDPSKFLLTDKWINFRYIDNLTVSGGGTLDGQGKVAWPYNDCKKNSHCRALPTTMRFDFVRNARVHHLRSIDSKNTHFILFGCQDMNISHVRISAPGDSPNTDGIKIGSSQRIGISHSIIGTGDDCISMLPGTREVNISDVVCGPGHGISVGSLGKSGDEDALSGIAIKNCTFRGTSDGVRIKTWAYPMFMDTEASNLVYEDIFMDNVGNPIIIDQEYCPVPPCKFVPSRVQISNITYRNIWGSSRSKVAVTLRCSQTRPCNNVVLEDINLSYVRGNANVTALCSHVNGHALGKQNPASCL
ncbi:exopolygalacturonase-like [Juglans microcarpa x Juglans regia]|uniref:exopolygalacturonase-like n=1 Tax=Juglans microcarpa x Juglans regia TaxID=2249226 RepID=UPI001B7E00E6|nr:exopolygalacturonase-like [Juglans microcarpa x Juglans regia]